MFAYLKYLCKYLASGQITTTRRWPVTLIRGMPSRQVTTHRIALTTGGFIEIVKDCIPNISYIRIHLGQPKRPHDLTETYKYVRYGTDKETVWLLRELRTAMAELVDTL
jgi:hypothetical protein